MNCPHCSARIEPGMTFCGVCGTPLTSAASAAAPERERRRAVPWWWLVVAVVAAAGTTFGITMLVAGDDGDATASATTEPLETSSIVTTTVTETTGGATSTTEADPDDSVPDPRIDRLDVVRARETLICGINGELPGFGLVAEDGTHIGFDVDFCRVVAAGVLGDPEAVEFVPLTEQQRFPALQAGEVDVLIRNTAWTATRDGQGSARFVFTTFYDGQGFMVPAASERAAIADLSGTSICVLSGTTTELNLAAVLDDRGIPFDPRPFADFALLRPAYEAGECDAWTADISQLAQLKTAIEGAGGAPQTIMAETISREPLGPVVLDGDESWAQAVQWSVMAPVLAWEYDLDAAAVEDYTGDDPFITLFLGLSDFDPGLGLAPDFAATIISGVGNYEEIFRRNLSPIGLRLEGSSNALWADGGLMYVPPYR